MTNPLTTLENDLGILATTAGVAQPVLTVAGDVLSLLADKTLMPSEISTAVSGVYNTIATTINNDAVAALNAIAGALGSISNPANLSAADIGSALNSLQNVLQTAQSLVPGGSSAAASALASTSQFATLFGNLLTEAGSVSAAEQQLKVIALQLGAIAGAFSTAASGTP